MELTPLRDFRATTEAAVSQLESLLPLSASITVLSSVGAIPPAVTQCVAKIEEFVAGLPEPTKQDAARDYLSVAQERLETYREASLALKKAQAQAELTKK